MNLVLESAKFVVERAKYVKINEDAIKEFSKTFTHEHLQHWWDAFKFNLAGLSNVQKLHFLLVFNALSFCYWGSPKWAVEYQGEKFDGAIGMITALKRAVDEGKSVLSARYLANVSKEDLEHILRANVQIPLFEERWKILREIGSVLVQKFDGDFANVLNGAKEDALELLRLIIANFPSFNDISTYEGRQILFYKRAQLLTADIGRGLGHLKNVQELTACADYKLPQVLRKLGILTYVPELAAQIDAQKPIPKDSPQEIEIRASTIWAVELIKREVKKRIPDIDSMHIGDHIWLESQKKSPTDKPYHLTLTTYY